MKNLPPALLLVFFAINACSVLDRVPFLPAAMPKLAGELPNNAASSPGLATATRTSTSTPTQTSTATPTRTLAPSPSPTPRCVPGPQVNLANARNGRIDTKFRSTSLGRDMPILIYLPPGYYDTRRCYPVLYMLHGYGGPYTEWDKNGLLATADSLIRSGQIQPMIVVLPEGEHSWWFNHWPVATPNNDGKPWGDYIWKDIVGYLDANYRTLDQPESRAVGGLSSGGQGAYMLGMTHPEIFSIVGGHSPSFREADGSLEFFGNQDYFNQYDPIWLVKNKTDNAKRLTIWMDAGSEDDVWGEGIQQYRKLLESLKVPYAWRTWNGGHLPQYWTAHAPDYLTWYSAVLHGQ